MLRTSSPLNALNVGRRPTSPTSDAQPLCQLDLAVIVAVGAVRVMQAPLDQVVHVIAMRDRFVATARTMNMAGFVAGSGRGATIGICSADLDHMLIDVIAMGMMEMPIVQIVHVPIVLYGCMPTAGAVLMIVMRMNFAVAHNGILLLQLSSIARVRQAFCRGR